MSKTLSFLVDAASVAADPELPYLLSFGNVEGLSIEQHVALVERPGQDSKAILGATGSRHVSLAPLNQFKQFAGDIAARPGCPFSADVVERALAYSFLAERLDVDAVVSPARSAFGPDDNGLLDIDAVITVGEALAMIGANVRQREEVPLGGSPMLVQQRSEVYPLTARVILPNGQEWWSSCLQIARPDQREWLGYAEAVFKRVGQALRGRDAVHEALRLGAGRSAILDALYHFDVVLTSSVGSLDALARIADEIFELSSKPDEIGWQKKKWRKRLGQKAAVVAGVVSREPRLAALRVLTTMRNSIHGIPLDEHLQAEVDPQFSRVEHYATISRDLSGSLRKLRKPLGNLDAYGIFIDDANPPFINVGQLTEQILLWLIEIIGELLGAMLSCDRFRAGTPLPAFAELDQMLDLCKALARVGTYPCRKGRTGLPAAPSAHRRVMGVIHEHRTTSA